MSMKARKSRDVYVALIERVEGDKATLELRRAMNQKAIAT